MGWHRWHDSPYYGAVGISDRGVACLSAMLSSQVHRRPRARLKRWFSDCHYWDGPSERERLE